MFNGLQWHVYVADANGAVYADELHPLAKPTHKLEVCMTDLGKQAARAFFRDPAKSASQVRQRALCSMLAGSMCKCWSAMLLLRLAVRTLPSVHLR
jgi:hypothetical protein